MNIFLKPDIAREYDGYYQSEFGRMVDQIEKEIISGLLRDVTPGKMIDLGCGTGHWTEYFVNKGFSVTGVDASPAMLDIARSKNINAEFVLSNAEELPFENESQGIIASIAMLEFVENKNKVIGEIYRILKNDGVFILGGLNADSVLGRNKEGDEVFKNANFWRTEELKSGFKQFNLLQIKQGLFLDTDYSIKDHEKNIHDIEPAFIAALFQKISS